MAKIDISDVPSDKLMHPEFLTLRAQMEAALSNQSWISAFCIHEAGHMTYLRELGITEYAYIGPRIVYDKQKDVFDGFMAAVQPKTDPEKGGPEALPVLAKALVAGGTFARTLTRAPDSGDEEDRQRFDHMCALIESKDELPKGTINCDQSWEEARQAVSIDLRSPRFRAKA
jgi:hypothetical protein